MKLTLNSFPVDEIAESRRTGLDGRRLLLNRRELRDLLLRDGRLGSVEIDLVRPGESCRIVNILDIFEPRIKASGGGEAFPGILGPARLAGSGTTHALRGMCVVTCGSLDGAEDALLDMAGPCADLSRFSGLKGVVVTLTFAEGLSRAESARAAVEAGVRASLFLGELLGEAARTQAPEASEVFELSAPSRAAGLDPSLPRIAYVYPLYSQGDARDMLLYGRNTRDLLPTLIHPNEVMDGAVVWSGFCRPTKNPTYDHLNHAVLRTLYAAHGKSIVFAGTIVANHPKHFTEKTLHAAMMARLAEDVLGADGVIITKDSGGQADTDLMQICEQCEERGVKTVLLTMEFAGDRGSSAGSLVDASPRADAIVSVGNCAETVRLPRMERVVGGARLKDFAQDPRDPVEVSYNKIPGAVGMLGGNALTAWEV
ncbi:MAG: beta-aspartyl-peptidase [Candidatus Tectomicrobia bacterium]|nr:beta-aspartyl-peptidase [Candidatus Tectomicrobia bacterium]